MVGRKVRVVEVNVEADSSASNSVEEVQLSSLDVVGDIAEFANGVASLVVGHRRILVDGGFETGLADVMCQALHAKLLGLDIWDSNGVVDEWPDFEPDEEDEE